MKNFSNEQRKRMDIRKNMKTMGEVVTKRLEKGDKDSPMQTVIRNSVHSKCFQGANNGGFRHKENASRTRDCELWMANILRLGKDITSCRNAEAGQTTQQLQLAELFSYFWRMFDVWEHRVRAGQDQPLFMPEVTLVVWTDVLAHLEEKLSKITDIKNLIRGKGRMSSTLTTIVIWEALMILFMLYQLVLMHL